MENHNTSSIVGANDKDNNFALKYLNKSGTL